MLYLGSRDHTSVGELVVFSRLIIHVVSRFYRSNKGWGTCRFLQLD